MNKKTSKDAARRYVAEFNSMNRVDVLPVNRENAPTSNRSDAASKGGQRDEGEGLLAGVTRDSGVKDNSTITKPSAEGYPIEKSMKARSPLARARTQQSTSTSSRRSDSKRRDHYSTN